MDRAEIVNMRPSQKSNRNRGKNNNRGGGGGKSLGNVVNRVFESAGPEGKVRGTPQQIIDKYEPVSYTHLTLPTIYSV